MAECSIGPWIVFEYMELGDLAQLLRPIGFSNLKEKEETPRHLLNQVLFNLLHLFY